MATAIRNYLNDPEVKEAFVEEVTKIHHELEELFSELDLSGKSSIDIPEEILRKLHTAKGTFLGVGLETEGKLSHLMEEILKSASGSLLPEALAQKLNSLLSEYISLLKLVEISPEDPETAKSAKELLRTAQDLLKELKAGPGKNETAAISRIKEPQQVKTALLQGKEVVKVVITFPSREPLPEAEKETIISKLSSVKNSGLERTCTDTGLSIYLIEPDQERLKEVIDQLKKKYLISAGRQIDIKLEKIGADIDRLLYIKDRQPALKSKQSSKIYIESRFAEELMLQIDSIRAIYTRALNDPEYMEQFMQKLRLHLRELEDILIQIRFETFESAFKGFRKIVEDLASRKGKKARLIIETPDVLVDKMLLSKLTEPLLHLIRNAVDHGIETPEERLKKGKDEHGNIVLKGTTIGNWLKITVEDDGRGIDWERVREKAIEKKLLSEGEHSVDILKKVLFAPGFTTREKADQFSGRGIGLDVVKATVEELGGTIEVESKPGSTHFSIGIPYEIFLLEALEVFIREDGEESVYIPVANIKEVLDSSRLVVSKDYHSAVFPDGKELPLALLPGSVREPKLFIALQDSEKNIFLLPATSIGHIQRRMFRKIEYISLKNPLLLGYTVREDGSPGYLVNVEQIYKSFVKS